MFLNPWSVALTLLSFLALSLTLVASKTAVKVLLFWNPDSDSSRQIRLENETWLASTLVEYGLGFQVISLVLFALAADNFSTVIAGAMCATGALTVNDYGIPVLFIKLGGVFFYGFWIVLHKLDISSEVYPLLRVKYTYLLLLLPLLLVDVCLQTIYISKLEPDIITSCCAVVFGEGQGSGNLLSAVPKEGMLLIFYGTALLLYVTGWALRKYNNKIVQVINGAVWLWFLVVSLVAITTLFSSYIYAMPYHRCPFCILKPEYHYIGFVIYGTLIPACFFGISATMVLAVSAKEDMRDSVAAFQRLALKTSLAFLTIFLLATSYHMVVYKFFGGES